MVMAKRRLRVAPVCLQEGTCGPNLSSGAPLSDEVRKCLELNKRRKV